MSPTSYPTGSHFCFMRFTFYRKNTSHYVTKHQSVTFALLTSCCYVWITRWRVFRVCRGNVSRAPGVPDCDDLRVTYHASVDAFSHHASSRRLCAGCFCVAHESLFAQGVELMSDASCVESRPSVTCENRYSQSVYHDGNVSQPLWSLLFCHAFCREFVLVGTLTANSMIVICGGSCYFSLRVFVRLSCDDRRQHLLKEIVT